MLAALPVAALLIVTVRPSDEIAVMTVEAGILVSEIGMPTAQPSARTEAAKVTVVVEFVVPVAVAVAATVFAGRIKTAPVVGSTQTQSPGNSFSVPRFG